MSFVSQVLEGYKGNKARFADLAPKVDDTSILTRAAKSLLRCYTTEFEYKVCRHLLRGRRKQELLSARISEFTKHTSRDWRVEAHPAVVKEIEKHIGADL